MKRTTLILLTLLVIAVVGCDRQARREKNRPKGSAPASATNQPSQNNESSGKITIEGEHNGEKAGATFEFKANGERAELHFSIHSPEGKSQYDGYLMRQELNSGRPDSCPSGQTIVTLNSNLISTGAAILDINNKSVHGSFVTPEQPSSERWFKIDRPQGNGRGEFWILIITPKPGENFCVYGPLDYLPCRVEPYLENTAIKIRAWSAPGLEPQILSEYGTNTPVVLPAQPQTYY